MGSETITGHCPHCRNAFTASRDLMGRRAKCNQCGRVFRIALPDSAPAQTPAESGQPPRPVASDPLPSATPTTPEATASPTLPRTPPGVTGKTRHTPAVTLKSIVKSIDDDVRSAKSFVQAKLEAKRLSQERRAAEGELNAVYGQIGAQAEKLGLGPDLPTFGGVVASRKKLTDAEAVLAQRRAAIQQAQEALQAETDKHANIIAALEIEHRRLSDTAAKAKSDLDSLKRQANKIAGDIARLQTALDAYANGTPQAEPVETVKRRLATCQRDLAAIELRLVPHRKIFDEASAAIRSKDDELNVARQSWRQVKSHYKEALQSTNAAEARAGRDDEDVRAAMNTSLQAFGKAVFDAGIGADQLAAEFQCVKAIQERTSEIDRRSSGLQMEATATSGKARRAAFWSAGFALLYLCLFIWGGKWSVVWALVPLLSYIVLRMIKADRLNSIRVKLGLARPASSTAASGTPCRRTVKGVEVPTAPENTSQPDGVDGQPANATLISGATGVPPETLPKCAFISHSSRDRELAQRVCDVLEGHGVTCWIAPRDIAAGAPYDEEILRGLKCSQTFILLLSDAANASQHVKKELMLAMGAGHTIYPIRIQEVQPGPTLKYPLEGIHWIDAWTPPIEEHLESLVQLIAKGPNADKRRSVRGGHLTGGPLWKMRRRRRMIFFVGIVAVLALLAVAWVASTWKDGVISGIVAYVTHQVDARVSNLPSSPSGPSAETTEKDQNANAGATIRKRDAQGNQVVTLNWLHNLGAKKSYPASEQILDDAGNVIGEVSLDPTDPEKSLVYQEFYHHTATLSFTKGKDRAVLFVFREDAAVGQSKVGKADGLSFSGRVMEIRRISQATGSSDAILGTIETITIQVTARR